MPRRPPEYREIHGEADKVELRVRRGLLRYAERLRSRLPMRELVAALEAGDARRADAVLDDALFEDALEPTAKILRDAFARAGKVIADEVISES